MWSHHIIALWLASFPTKNSHATSPGCKIAKIWGHDVPICFASCLWCTTKPPQPCSFEKTPVITEPPPNPTIPNPLHPHPKYPPIKHNTKTCTSASSWSTSWVSGLLTLKRTKPSAKRAKVVLLHSAARLLRVFILGGHLEDHRRTWICAEYAWWASPLRIGLFPFQIA